MPLVLLQPLGMDDLKSNFKHRKTHPLTQNSSGKARLIHARKASIFYQTASPFNWCKTSSPGSPVRSSGSSTSRSTNDCFRFSSKTRRKNDRPVWNSSSGPGLPGLTGLATAVLVKPPTSYPSEDSEASSDPSRVSLTLSRGQRA